MTDLTLTQAHAAWFANKRGITAETLAAFGVWTDGNAVVMPYPEGEKRRWNLEAEGGERGFSFTKGAKPSFYSPVLQPPLTEGSVVFLCEGETDTMRLWQELQAEGLDLPVCGVSGSNGWPANAKRVLGGVKRVYCLLDNDRGYQASASTDTFWEAIQATLGDVAQRVWLPEECKDVCQFLAVYDLAALRAVVEAPPPPPRYTYSALDLMAEPPPIRWLVEDTLALGDTTLLAGEPGVGKTWLSLGLTVAIAEGWPTWLGYKVNAGSGRVLYVDEENPVDVVYDRLVRLGLTGKGAANIRFLHRQGVRLDRNPKALLDEARAWRPELVVLDSLSRLHGQDESSNGAMAGLFNDGINPLARISGSAVMLLHHVTKGDSNSSFQRVRGAGDISGSIDAGMDLRVAAVGGFINLVYFKSRRRPAGDTTPIRIKDLPGGGVEVTQTGGAVNF